MVYNRVSSGRSAGRLARTVRVREVGGSSPLAPTFHEADGFLSISLFYFLPQGLLLIK